VRTLVVFEDPGQRAFSIVTAVRGVFDLRCGARTLLERFVAAIRPERLVLLPRFELAPLLAETHGPETGMPELAPAETFKPGEAVFINGRLLALGQDVERSFEATKGEFAACLGETLVFARCLPATATKLAQVLRATLQPVDVEKAEAETFRQRLARQIGQLPLHDLDVRRDWNRDGSILLDHVWQLVEKNADALIDDFAQGPGAGIDPGARVDPGVHWLEPSAIRVEADTRLRPGVILDAESGPITISAGTDIQPHVVVRGPAYVGPRCLLKAGTKIQGNTSLGPVCKLGGEVEGSILQGWSNKQHEGFLGHAYVAEWVNFGADTNNSDLKNNYGSVKMWEAGELVDTGLLFIGLVAADHVKTAINTQFNTGTVVGLASQIAAYGFPPKFVPPFGWCGPSGIERYAIERALHTARVVMSRRGVVLTPAYEVAFRRAFANRDRPM